MPLETLAALLGAAEKVLGARCMCAVVQRRAAGGAGRGGAGAGAGGGGGGGGAEAPLHAWRLSAARLAHVETLCWLLVHCRANARAHYRPHTPPLIAGAPTEAEGSFELLVAWARAAGRAAEERRALLSFACSGQTAASRRVEILGPLLQRWQSEVARRVQLGGAEAAAEADEPPLTNLAELVDVAAMILIKRLEATSPAVNVKSPAAAAGAFEAIGQLLALGAAAELRAPRALSTYVSDESQPEASRLSLLELLHRSDANRAARALAAADDGEAARELELLRQLHARRVLRAMYAAPSPPSPPPPTSPTVPPTAADTAATHSEALEASSWALAAGLAVIAAPGALQTTDGMGAAFAQLLACATAPALAGDLVERLVGLAELLSSWRPQLIQTATFSAPSPPVVGAAATAADNDATAAAATAPPLHAECAALLELAVRRCGCGALVRLRRALPPPPILTLAEEHSLMTSLRGSSLRGSSSPPILTLVEGHSLAAEVHASALEGARAGASEGGAAAPGMAPGAVGAAAAAAAERHAERACTTSAMLSGWPTLEDGALSALASASATSLGFGDAAAELELLELLLLRGWLPRLAGSNYWARALAVLRDAPSDALPARAIAALGTARLYGLAGSIVLHRSRVHPALHSAAARLGALRAYCRERVAATMSQGGRAGTPDELELSRLLQRYQ